MLNRELTEKTERFLREKFDAALYLNAHPEAKAYRLEHSYRVANIGVRIARGEGFDETETAGRLWRERLDFYASFLEKLAAQLENSRSITG